MALAPAQISLAPAVNQGARLNQRLAALQAAELDFIPNPGFADMNLAEDSTLTDVDGQGDLPADLPAHLARLCEAELLTAEQERELFCRMNYFKFRAQEALDELEAEGRLSEERISRAENCLRQSKAARDRIVRSNMRLVISVVKKFVTPQQSFDEMLSDGIMTMMNAVDRFDFDRGFRFSTYAYRSIARNAYRTIADRQKENSRFANCEDGFEVEAETNVSAINEQKWESLLGLLSRSMDQLDRREKFIIRGRYALGAHQKIRTFQSLADKLGVSKERVRQLEKRAILKLRQMAEDLHLEEILEPASN